MEKYESSPHSSEVSLRSTFQRSRAILERLVCPKAVAYENPWFLVLVNYDTSGREKSWG